MKYLCHELNQNETVLAVTQIRGFGEPCHIVSTKK